MSLGYIVSIEIKETKTCKSNIKTWNIGKHENCRIGCCQWQRTCVISKRDNTGHVRGELFEGRLLLGVRGQSLGLPNQLNYLRCALPIWKIISSYLILNSETRIDCRYHPPPPEKKLHPNLWTDSYQNDLLTTQEYIFTTYQIPMNIQNSITPKYPNQQKSFKVYCFVTKNFPCHSVGKNSIGWLIVSRLVENFSLTLRCHQL